MSSFNQCRAAIPRRSHTLHTTARHASRFDELRMAIDDGMNAEKDLSSIGKRGETLLHAAVYSNNPDSVACVLRGRPELLAAKDAKGETPLHKAIRLKPSNAKGIQRQQTILKMLLDEERVDLNSFGDYVRVKKSGGDQRNSWRLNILRFAIVFNGNDPVVALLEAHGATMGHDPSGTDEPHNDPVVRSSVFPKRHSRRVQFFVGLIRQQAGKPVAGQYLMLRRYPAAVHLGSPTLEEIEGACSDTRSQSDLLEHLLGIGTHFPVPELTNALERRMQTPFLFDVMAMEGGVSRRLVVGQMLRCVRRSSSDTEYEAICDVLLTDFTMSSHQQASAWDYRESLRYLRQSLLELEEMQAPVLFEAADLV